MPAAGRPGSALFVQMLQQQRLQEWVQALRNAAKIVDRRDVVLKPADDTDQQALPPLGRAR